MSCEHKRTRYADPRRGGPLMVCEGCGRGFGEWTVNEQGHLQSYAALPEVATPDMTPATMRARANRPWGKS